MLFGPSLVVDFIEMIMADEYGPLLLVVDLTK